MQSDTGPVNDDMVNGPIGQISSGPRASGGADNLNYLYANLGGSKEAYDSHLLEYKTPPPGLEPIPGKLGPTASKEDLEKLDSLIRTFEVELGVAAVKWKRPEKMPLELYEGIVAHLEIAMEFRRQNPPTGRIVTNTKSVSKILDLLGMPDVERGSALKPDILDTLTSEVWEIKSLETGSFTASVESEWYRSVLGESMFTVPGRSTAPGTHGEKQTIAGHLVWFSDQPGVILYEYRRRSPEPKTVPTFEESPDLTIAG